MGEPVLILAFVVIVIGGIGSVEGAFVGAVLVGVTDTMRRVLLPQLLAAAIGPAQAAGIGAALSSMLIYIVMALDPGVPAQGPVRGAGLTMRREAMLNLGLALLLPALPLAAQLLDEPFYVTLATRMAILALAAAGLNLALGFGGLVSFGARRLLRDRRLRGRHPRQACLRRAADHDLAVRLVGIGPDAGRLARRGPVLRAGGAGHRRRQPQDQRRLLHHDHAGLRADDLLFRHFLAGLWRRGRAVDHGAQQLSGGRHRRSARGFSWSATRCSWRRCRSSGGCATRVSGPHSRPRGRTKSASPRSASSRSVSASSRWCFPLSSREWPERCLPTSTASSARR